MTDLKNSNFEAELFISDIIKRKVLWNGKKIGKLQDIVIVDHEKLPEVSHFVVARSFGHKSLLVPWARVKAIHPKAVEIDIESIEQYEAEPAESQVLLRDHILDKKVIDMDDNEIDVVYDVKLVLTNKRLYVTDVDFSKYGLLKRIGFRWVASVVYSLAEIFKKETLSWSYVAPLPKDISSFKGNVKLNVLKEKLPEIHPVDLADMLEEMEEGQRLALFKELDTEQASDTLEEIEPRVQRTLISSLERSRVAELINEMTPAQGADVLAILPSNEADEIMHLMDQEKAQKIEQLLSKHYETILNLATSRFLKFPDDLRVTDAIRRYRNSASDKDVDMYIYVVDDNGKLLGVVDIQELLQARLEERLSDIMIEEVISLHPDASLQEAVEIFSRYNFRALPVTDEAEHILGVIPYRDIMNLEHNFI
ncbi:MAG: CBS domain-containing protein [Desulfobacteraceae bacterium]|nr:CBS domain-containing protein [Desulfobacteraceae bacterium]